MIWFDKEQLEPGVDWKETIREAVEEGCGLFLSLISASTVHRLSYGQEDPGPLDQLLLQLSGQHVTDTVPFALPDDAAKPLLAACSSETCVGWRQLPRT